MGRRRKSLKCMLVSALLVAPVLGGCGGTQAVPGYIAPEIADRFSGSDPGLVAALLDEQIDGDPWIRSLLFGAPNRADPRLPNYAYFQGPMLAKHHIVIAGQVRVVGGIVGTDEGVASLYAGAMVTSNPYAFTNASDVLQGGPAGIRTRVGHWEEIPTPP